MKKVLFIRRNPTCIADGTVNYCLALTKMFQNDDDIEILPIVDYPEIQMPLFRFIYNSRTLTEAFKEADIIHVNGYTSLGVAQAMRIAKSQGKYVVYTAHWHPFNRLNHPFWGKIFFNRIIKPYVRRFVDVVTTINREDTAFFSSFHSQVIMIPHWMTTQAVCSNASIHQPNMILFVGRTDDPVKGFEHLYHLPIGKYEIHIVGRGNIKMRKDFVRHIDISNEELEQLYLKASLTVVPSFYEAFSYVALESLTHGTPVVMSDNVRIADHLGDIQGYTIFPFHNFYKFCEAVEQTIGTPVDTSKVEKNFSPDHIRLKYKKVYMGHEFKSSE